MQFFHKNKRLLIVLAAVLTLVLALVAVLLIAGRDSTPITDDPIADDPTNGDDDPVNGDDPGEADDPGDEHDDDADLPGEDEDVGWTPPSKEPGQPDEETEWYVISETGVVSSPHGVVSTADRVATLVGLEVLKNGGNAFDAAVAVGLALGVVEPFGSGIGGCGVGIFYDAETGTVTSLIFRSRAPLAVDVDAYMDEESELALYGITAGAVPGAVMGYIEILDRYGTMSFAELAEPSIKLARDGVEVSPFFAQMIVEYMFTLRKDSETAGIFVPWGLPLFEGDLYVNSEYADILQMLADNGPEDFYTGEVAQIIVSAAAAQGSYFTLEDFESYEVTWGEPISTTYRGHEIFVPNLPTAGVAVLEMLKIMEYFDVPTMGPGSADKLHFFAEAMKQATRDRFSYVADPDYADDQLILGLISEAYAISVAETFDINHASRYQSAVSRTDLEYFAEEYAKEMADQGGSTTHFAIIDSQGNMVLITQTLGQFFGGGKVVPGTGMLLNSQMDNFSTSPTSVNYLVPGKVVRTSMAPAIIFKDGRPVYGVGTPGGSRIPSTMAQIISNLVDHEMDLFDAVDYPLMFADRQQNFEAESRLDPQVVADLIARGHDVVLRGERNSYFGGVQAVQIDWDAGVYRAMSDMRRVGASGGLLD